MKELYHKVSRLLSRGLSQRILPDLESSIISFGFDDCPSSAIENALPRLENEDWRATIYVACGLCETENHLGKHMSLTDIVDVHERGHEIADHTYSHISTKDVSTRPYLADIKTNQAVLQQLGLPKSRHFAYPYGDITPFHKSALAKHFETSRGVISSSKPTQDANLLNAVRVYSGHDFQIALQEIHAASRTPQWLNLFTHDVRESPSAYGCTPSEFQTIIDAVKNTGLRVMTVDKAYRAITKGDNVS